MLQQRLSSRLRSHHPHSSRHCYPGTSVVLGALSDPGANRSLGRAKADAARLLQLSPDHWGIENRLHYVRDATCGEDAGRTAAPKAPQVLSGFRSTVLALIRRLGFRPAEGFEHFAEHRNQAFRLILTGRIE
jgi:hypothetical protein